MTTQPEALRLAAELDDGYPLTGDAISAAEELRRQHARIAELEAQLSAIGADGVSPLMNAAQEATHLRELAAYRLTVENLEREIAAQQPAPSPAPARWPTDQMIEAGRKAALSHGPLLGNGQSLWHVFRDMLAAAPSPAPAGWKLVPVAPTEEMLKAADDGDDAYTLRCFGPDVQRVMQGPYDHYCAMLDAAPTAQADTPPAHQWDVDYPPIPSLHGGSELWRAIGKHRRAITGHETDQAAAQVDSAVIKMLCAYVDSDRAARAPADSVLEDAARYRHLRDCNSGSLAVMQITGTGEDDWHVLTEHDADAAIDAAMNKGGSA